MNATTTHDLNAGNEPTPPQGDKTPHGGKTPHDGKSRSSRRTLSPRDAEARIDTVARRCRQVVALIALLMTLVCATLVAGPIYNDIKLHKDKETAIATVNHVGPLRTAISFRDSSGEFHSPTREFYIPADCTMVRKCGWSIRTATPTLSAFKEEPGHYPFYLRFQHLS